MFIMNAKIVKNQSSLAELSNLLKSNKLPFQDIQLGRGVMVSYCDAGDRLIGSGGIEVYGSFALMRSVAVDARERGKSLGREIVDDLLERAKVKGVNEVYLLTDTARGFFARLGFTDVPREQVPEAVHESTEFKSVCPASAACMVYRINP